MSKRKGRHPNKKNKKKQKAIKTNLRHDMVQDIQAGGALFPGWKVTRDNKVELDYNHFKKHFGNKTNFAAFFRNVLSDATPLNNKVRDVRQALTKMNATITQEAQAFQKALASYELSHLPSMRYANRPTMFYHLKAQVMNVLKNVKKPYVAKWSMRFQMLFKKWDSQETMLTTLYTKSKLSTNYRDALLKYREIQDDLEGIIENMDARNGSGWYPQRIAKVWLNVHDHNPIAAGSYFPIPTYDNAKCGLVNIKNTDNRCLFWSLTAAKDYLTKSDKNPKTQTRTTTDRYKKAFQKYWDQLEPSVQQAIDDGVHDELSTFAQVERIFHVKVYVMEMNVREDGCDEPYLIFRGVQDYKQKVFLLRAVKVSEEQEQAHFVWIKNPEHFISRTMRGNDRHNANRLCWDCLQWTPKNEIDKHVCEAGFQTNVFCPSETEDGPPVMRFKGGRKSIEAPMMIIADFESINRKIEVPCGAASTKTSVQEACSFAFLPIATTTEEETGVQYTPDDLQLYCGENAARVFLDRLTKYCDRNYFTKLDKHIKMATLTAEEQTEFDTAETCCLCKKPGLWDQEDIVGIDADGDEHRVEKDNKKVRHHCHFTGKYQGPAHNKCNRNASQWPIATVLFHNLKGYDSHFLMKSLRPYHGNPKIMGDNAEKIKTMMLTRYVYDDKGKRHIYQIRFIDSFAFLSSSLDILANLAIDFNEDPSDQIGQGLVKNLPLTSAYLDKSIRHTGIPKALLKKACLRKGYFPYEYLDSLSKLDQALFDEEDEFTLEPEDFYSHLSNKLSQDLVIKSSWAEMISRGMGFETLREYHDFYLAIDVYLLADIFQRFRLTCLKANNCGQDPLHYLGSPSLVLDSYLKHKEADLELFTDTKLYLKCRSEGMRGGISYWRRYFTKANNEMHPDYDPTQERSEILDMDATSLYPYAARQRLPTGDFEFVEEEMQGETMWEFILQDLPEEEGYYAWVDIHLPLRAEEWQQSTPTRYHRHAQAIYEKFDGNLHDYQQNYPILVENKEVPTEFLSEHQRSLYEATNGKHVPTNKLINDLLPKTRYMMHYLSIRQALETGWVITKVHERLEFRQEYCVKDFLDQCVELRAKAKNPVEKTLQKTNMNSLIGKFIEDVMKHSDFRMWRRYQDFKVNERKGRLKPNWYILSENMVVAELLKKKTELNKPIMLGIAVYDISKLLMSHLWYLLQNHYGRNIELCGTDTDSLIFHVKTQSWQADAAYLNQFSVFAEDHPFYRNSRFSDATTQQLLEKGINPYIGIFDLGTKEHKYLKSIPGFFKPDHDRIIEACAMRAKMYSFLRNTDVQVNGEWQKQKVWQSHEQGKWRLEDLDKQKKGDKHRDVCKAKGIPSAVVEERFTHEYYRSIVLNPLDHVDEEVTFSSLKSQQHSVHQFKQTKASLRPVDDKRHSEDGIVSLPHGHYLTNLL